MSRRRSTALALLLLVTAWAVGASLVEAGHSKKDGSTQETVTEEPHHKPFDLYHMHHHHRHYHHYRDHSKHWVAGLLLALVGAVLGTCAAVGLWRRLCARRQGALELRGGACPPFAHVDAPLLQPPPLPLASPHAKEAPPPYKETWA